MTLWGFSKRWSAPFEVVVPGDRRPPGIKVHRSRTLARRDVTKHLGIRVTTPARTLLDCAPRLPEKARTRAVNDALLSRYLTQGALAEILDRLPSCPAARLLRPFVSDDGGPTRSDLEDAFLGFCERFGLPRPETNVPVAGYLVDAWFAQERLIVELDGYDFHRSRSSFEGDRNRDADTLLAGLATVRVTWRRMRETPEAEATRLDRILRARRRDQKAGASPP
jgi:very-short-patch-repair endonuclease